MTPQDIFELYGFYDSNICVKIERTRYEVICSHPYPLEPRIISNDELETTPVPLGGQPGFVQLTAVANGSKTNEFGGKEPNIIGYIGKCSICGKIYYK